MYVCMYINGNFVSLVVTIMDRTFGMYVFNLTVCILSFRTVKILRVINKE